MSDHLLVLQVVIPLIAVPLCLLIRRPNPVWWIVLAVSAISFYVAIALLLQVLETGEIIYYLGNWAAPWGIEYRLDIVNAFVLIIIAAIGTIVAVYAGPSVRREIDESKAVFFYAAWLLNLTGLFGVIVTGDAFNLFVFIEIASLSSYALISMGKERQALMAAYRYLIMGTIGATFILIGVGLLYVITGTLNMADLKVRMVDVENTRTLITALAFLTTGIGLKFAMFPLHAWLPGAYTHAPSVVSSLLAGTSTKVYVYVLLRFLFSIFGAEFAFDAMRLDQILLVCALFAILGGSIAAIMQTNIKRMLAWSSIAQIGYMLLGISLVSVTGLLAGIIHIFNHALMKTALFLCVGCVFYQQGFTKTSDFRGVGQTMPWTMAAFVISGLSLIGAPLTAGFISKWYLVSAALEGDHVWLAVAILIGSLLAVVYIWRVVEIAWLQKPEVPNSRTEAPLLMLVPLWLLVFANLYFGINATLTADLARQAAEILLGYGT